MTAFLFLSININAQQTLSVDDVLSIAIENNASLKAAALRVTEKEALIGSAFDFNKTNLYYSYDENNIAINNEPLKVIGVQQDFQFPTIYFANKKVNKAIRNVEQSKYDIQLQTLKKNVYLAYYDLSYAYEKLDILRYLDSLYQNFYLASKRRFELGETNYLEMITARSKHKQLETLYKQALHEVDIQKVQLSKTVQKDLGDFRPEFLRKLDLQINYQNTNAGLQYYENEKNFYRAFANREKQRLLPDISFEYFQGTNSTLNSNMRGYQFGVKIPLLFSGHSSKIKASKYALEVAKEQQAHYKILYNAEYNSLISKLNQYHEGVLYYETQGKELSNEIIKVAESSFKHGEIDFFQYIQSIENAKDIELTYLNDLNNYNKTIITIHYLTL